MSETKKIFAYLKLLVLLFVLIGVPAILYFTCRDTLFNREWLANLPQFIMQYKGHAALILGAIQVMQVIICIIPGQPIQLAASYAFGIFKGYLISVIGALIGAFAAFYIAKVLGKDALIAIFGQEKVEDYHRKLNSGRGYMAVLLIYLIPGIPKDLVAYVAGISSMRVRPFLLLSTIGRTPGMLGSLLTGYFLSRKNYVAIGILAVIIAIILGICFVKRKKLVAMLDDLEKEDQEIDREIKNKKQEIRVKKGK